MSKVASIMCPPEGLFERPVGQRAAALADRLEQGARTLAIMAAGLSETDWQMKVPGDGRTVGVIVHHVASVYPIEVDLAEKIGSGEPIAGLTAVDIDALNAAHARQYDGVSKEEALDLLRRNSVAAAAAIRAMTDDTLDRAAKASLYANAPVTCQFVLEDHAVRHSYHHFAGIMRALQSRVDTRG